QHGFLPGKSCTTQLIPFIDSLALSLNNGLRTDVIYFDFAKAFDSVNHDIILRKLKYHFKVDGAMLKFLVNYLQNRMQRVVIDQHMSSVAQVISGVPQGSILGPLLFVLFIDDMHSVVSPGTNIALYADDTKIWRTISSSADSVILDSDINALNNWASTNLMRFHPTKCKVVCVAHKNKTLSVLPFFNYPFSYSLGDNCLEFSEIEKDLGIHVHESLHWNLQTSSLIAKATQRFNLLRRTYHFVKNQKKKRALYLTMVRSIFQHGSVLWSPSAVSTIDQFEAIQKRAVKWILNEQSYSYSNDYYTQKLIDLDILPMAQKFVYNDMVMLYKIINNLVPVSLPDYVILRINTRSSANANMLGIDPELVCHPIKNIFGHSFFPRSISTWNHLPKETKESVSIGTFKANLNSYLWNLVTSSSENSHVH
ncbi:MAG: reverse transcriptase family protein, partial [Cytophagales bacterium]|nr:reverse transcriptase family protein [Cytophagales bacterium]